MHVSNYITIPCALHLICLVRIFSFAANQPVCFPTSIATCSVVPCLVNRFNIRLTIQPLLLRLNIIIPLTIMNFELSSYCLQPQAVHNVSNRCKAWFRYISQTKSYDFAVIARSCDPDVLREGDSQLCSLIFFIRPFNNPAINVMDKMCGR